MEIIADTGRKIGKSTALIKLAAESGGVVVVTTRSMARSVHLNAERLGLKLTEHQIISYRQIINGCLRGRPVQKILYFDDWDYTSVTISRLSHESFGYQVGGIVTAKTRAEIEICLQNT